MINAKIANDMTESLKQIVKPYIITERDHEHNKARCELNIWL